MCGLPAVGLQVVALRWAATVHCIALNTIASPVRPPPGPAHAQDRCQRQQRHACSPVSKACRIMRVTPTSGMNGQQRSNSTRCNNVTRVPQPSAKRDLTEQCAVALTIGNRAQTPLQSYDKSKAHVACHAFLFDVHHRCATPRALQSARAGKVTSSPPTTPSTTPATSPPVSAPPPPPPPLPPLPPLPTAPVAPSGAPMLPWPGPPA